MQSFNAHFLRIEINNVCASLNVKMFDYFTFKHFTMFKCKIINDGKMNVNETNDICLKSVAELISIF